ncbi:MAG TPA: hypothetical protein DIU39_04710 [Flavobacteriales bacterium]|nr:hypothetical protein [Flavobacteriales bacterium]
MSFIHEHLKQQQYYRPKNRFKHQNLNNNLHLKSKKDDKWLEPVLNQTYNWFSPLFNSDDDNMISSNDRYYFNETNLDRDFDKKSKQIIPPFIQRIFYFIIKLIGFLFKKATKSTAKIIIKTIDFAYRKAEQTVVLIVEKMTETG